ncbi:MAG: hypothetical protein H0W49_13455 [Nitrospirales bacterium]|nr:hypothetical protein [Nitrospirales bacterium]
MTTARGLSYFEVRALARKIDDGSLRFGSSLAGVVSHQYGDWTPEAWQWNGGWVRWWGESLVIVS